MTGRILLWLVLIKVGSRLNRWVRKKRFYVLLILWFLLYNILQLRSSETMFRWRLASADYEPQFGYYEHEDRSMRYVEIGDDKLPLIMFLHGSPSSSSIWMSYLGDSLLLSKAKLLAVDRPGYGYSGYGDIETSVEAQAAAVAPILKAKRPKHRKIILIGSSYGGTVAARLAMDYPELVDGVVFQSASFQPQAETIYWISYPTTHWSLRWLVPAPFDVANAEKLAHREQLEKMRSGWDKITAPCTILHGDADGLIFPKNAHYARQKLTNARSVGLHMVADRGHTLTWTAPQLIKKSLIEMLDIVGDLQLAQIQPDHCSADNCE